MAAMRTGITFDDVLLVPTLSPVRSRKDVVLRTQLTRNISLNNPIVSSNMDTVTEADMAIEMARNGGVGILHRFLTPENQAEMVRRVKRAESYIIEDPYTLRPEQTLADYHDLVRQTGVGTFIVVDTDNNLEGVISSRDTRFHEALETPVSDLMTKRDAVVTGDADISLENAKQLIDTNRVKLLPLVNGGNKLTGLITARDLLNMQHRPYASLDEEGHLLVGAAIGVKMPICLERAQLLVDAGVDFLCMDIAHGHSLVGIDTVTKLKEMFPDVDLIAGNVATAAGTRALIEAGADAIKVGVGPGSICITRIVTGCGVPQLTAIMDCAAEAAKDGIPVIADGGIRTSGDICKAIAAGAQTVMLGSLLAGTTESPGQVITKNNRKVKVVRGMAGYGANLAARAKMGKDQDIFDVVPEGVEAAVPFRGPVAHIVKQLCGGLCSGISYCGGHTIPELQANAEFIRITGAGKKESGSHDVALL